MDYADLSNKNGDNKPFAMQEKSVISDGKEITIPLFLSLQEVADRTIFSLSALKRMKKEQKLPSVNIGTRCYINYPAFLSMLEENSKSGNYTVLDKIKK